MPWVVFGGVIADGSKLLVAIWAFHDRLVVQAI
jgi:hypothetical protein